MFKRNVILPFLLCFAVLSICVAGADKDKDKTGGEKVKQDKKVEVGFEERIRSENWNNIMDYNDAHMDEHRHWRFRTRTWISMPLGDRFRFYFGLNNETRKITQPPTTLKMDEVIIENAYLDMKITNRVSVRFGRQNIMRGEGFIIFDGNPLDGSRTAYFNAVDVTYHYSPKGQVELMGISDPRIDIYMPVINEMNKYLIEWDEQAGGVYWTDKSLERTSLEGYYFYKREAHDYRLRTNPQYQPERRVNTLGGRVVQRLDRGWSVTGEFAGQWGRQHPDTDIRAWGGYAYVTKAFEHPWKPAVSAGYWAMSGDDPNTAANEDWDPLFSRWPKWSELYIYSQVVEKGPSYWTNTGMWQAQVVFSPVSRFKARATYYHMSAFHPFTTGSDTIFGTGKRRGDLFEARLDFTINKNWKGHVLYEGMLPGNFYAHDDSGYFVRFELIYHFNKLFLLDW